ncbi:hypothetical protein MMC07_006256 [Pseudocyphellaria aurata]|nr:hypothetical protein [Pseudocyphellaria aurata]
MSFLHNSLSRAWRPKSSDILPGHQGQSRKAEREALTSVRPVCSSSSGRNSDVVDENLPPKVRKVASNAFLSISNTLRSKARIFYIDSVKAQMDKPVDTTSEETSATRPSCGSHAGATGLGHSNKNEQNFSEHPASTGGPKDSQKFLELTTSSPLKQKEILTGSEANCLKRSLVDDDYPNDGFPAYLEPFNFECFRPRELDFTSDDDCSPVSFDDGVSMDESSDQESTRFVTRGRIFESKFLNFDSNENGVTDHGPWPFKPTHSSTFNQFEPIEALSVSVGFGESTLAAPNKAHQAYKTDSEGSSSSSCSSSSASSSFPGSLNTEAQYPQVMAPNTKKREDSDTSSANDSTCSERESDLLTELARFPNCFKNPATDGEEAMRKIEMPTTATQSVCRGSHNSERQFNAAKLPEFNAFLPNSHVSPLSIQTDPSRWVLPPVAIPDASANDYESVGFTDNERFW